MSIESVNGTDSSMLAAWLETMTETRSTTAISSSETGSTEATSATPTEDSSKLSGMSKLFSQLTALAKDDPEKFKAACAEIASQLKSAAEEADDEEAQALTQMAEQFSAAAESGDASDLMPPKPPEGAAPPQGGYPPQGGDAATEDAHKAAGDLLEQIAQSVLAKDDTES